VNSGKINNFFILLLFFAQWIGAQTMHQAITDLNNSQYEKAIREFIRVWEKDTSNIEPLRLTGYAYKKMGKIPEAIEYYQKVLNQNKEDYDARLALARLYRRSNNYEKSEEYYTLILNNDSTDVEALWGLSDLCLIAGRLNKAEWYARQAAKFLPDHVSSYFRLARIYQAQGKLDKARKAYWRIADIDPTYAEIWAGLAQLDYWENRPFRAVQYYQKALTLDPANAQYRNKLQQVLRETRFHLLLHSGYVREIEEVVDYDTYSLGVHLQKRLNDRWGISLINREYNLQRNYLLNPNESSIQYDVTAAQITFYQPGFKLSAQAGYSLADNEFKTASVHGFWDVLPNLRLYYGTGFDFFYAWENLFSEYVDLSLRLRWKRRWSFIANSNFSRITNDRVYDYSGNLVQRDNDRIVLKFNANYLAYRPFLLKFHLKYSFIDHRFISPFHYTPQWLSMLSGGISAYKELGIFYFYGQEFWGSNTDDVQQNIASLEGGFQFKDWTIGLNFFYFYNKYYEDGTVEIIWRGRF